MNRIPARFVFRSAAYRAARLAAHPAARGGARRGVTMVESLICLAVVAVTLGTVVPGFDSTLERRRVEGAAAQLETDLQLTRSLAVAQNRTVRFEFVSDAHGSCYVVHNGSAGDCTCAPQGAACAAGITAHRVAHFAADSGVAVAANVRSMVFEPTRGTVTPTGTVRVEGQRAAVHQVVNIMGRIRSCTPDSKTMAGYKVC